jgi:hypothetical protein
MMPDDREARIRERAHRIWESEGRPDDRDQVHWEIATRIIDEEDAATASPEEQQVDDAIEMSFPASDPPSHSDPTTGIVEDSAATRKRRSP